MHNVGADDAGQSACLFHLRVQFAADKLFDLAGGPDLRGLDRGQAG